MWSRSSISKSFDKQNYGNIRLSEEAERKSSVDSIILNRNSEPNTNDDFEIETEVLNATVSRARSDSTAEKINVDPLSIVTLENEISGSKVEPRYYTAGKSGSFYSSKQKIFKNSCGGTDHKPSVVSSHRRMRERLRKTKASTSSLRYVIYLTISFVLCTAPTMGLLSVDILSPNLTLNMVLINSFLVCPFVYCYLCPFILVKCLPGVKNSLSDLILSVYSTSK